MERGKNGKSLIKEIKDSDRFKKAWKEETKKIYERMLSDYKNNPEDEKFDEVVQGYRKHLPIADEKFNEIKSDIFDPPKSFEVQKTFFKVMFENSWSLQEAIIGAGDEETALKYLQEEQPEEELTIKDVMKLEGQGVLVTKTLRKKH